MAVKSDVMKATRFWMILAVFAMVILTAGMWYFIVGSQTRRLIQTSKIDAETELDKLHLDLPVIQPSDWVKRYLPNQSEAGFNLVLYRRRIPMLIDMNGRIVHAWPKVRAVGRVRLSREGRLAVIGIDNLVKEYDWDGNPTWYYRLPDEKDFPHHDLIQLQNGNYLVLARSLERDTDFLHEVNSKGKAVWKWRSIDHREHFPNWNSDRKDPTHINSINEIPENPWYANGDERFRPGNILVSARHLDTIFIIDKLSGDVVWQYSKGLDYQHEAMMIKKGVLGEGHIMVFNNGRNNLNAYRRSLVQVIDPVRDEVVWEYGSKFFFSSVAGTSQKLPGKNILITSSHGGRVFEITPEKRIVWEWVPPYLPMRVERLEYDHCPQLASRIPKETVTVPAQNRRPFVDAELYAFATADQTVTRKVDGNNKQLLRENSGCRELLIPPGAEMWTEYGINAGTLRGRELSARFFLTIEGKGEAETLIDDVISSDSESLWKGRSFALREYSFRKITMCLDVDIEGKVKNSSRVVVWTNPLIISKIQRPKLGRPQKQITEQEEKVRLQQLEALGYIH